MGLSINTNVGAFVALQQLTKTTSQLENTQLRITTGLRVNGPKDDASNFSIATRLRGDIKGIESVKTALSTGDSIVNTAIQAGKAIADLLTDMKAKVIQANQSGLDSASRTALNNDFTSLRDQLTTIVVSAEFNNTNLITSGASTLTVLSTVDGSTITVSAQSMDIRTLGISASVLNTSLGASTSLTAINTAINLIADKLAALGSSSKRIEIQSEFTQQLVDILKEGVGNLVDADLAEESARLQALQINSSSVCRRWLLPMPARRAFSPCSSRWRSGRKAQLGGRGTPAPSSPPVVERRTKAGANDMATKTDIWSSASLLIDRYGEESLDRAADKAKKRLRQVDIEGAARWWLIFSTVKEIQRTERFDGEPIH
jgi:flagellin